MYVNIDLLLRQQGKTRYWLCDQVGCTYKSIAKLCNNETNSIHFDFLERICDVLECEIQDVLVREKMG